MEFWRTLRELYSFQVGLIELRLNRARHIGTDINSIEKAL